MRKRLSNDQKLAAVRIVLFNADHPMSCKEIARKVGFRRGESVTPFVKYLWTIREADWKAERTNFGTSYRVWELTPSARKALRKQGYDDGWPEGT
jgi:hypothetical protein